MNPKGKNKLAIAGDELARRVFNVALERPPTEAETDGAVQVLGAPPSLDGIADLLWAIVMLPGFQMVY